MSGLFKSNLAFMALASIALVGCQSSDATYGMNAASVENMSTYGDQAFTENDLSDVSYYKTDELITQGVTQFKAKNYGKSYALFKRSVDLFPNDAQAWLGLAASADEIGRFDTSDIAYRKLAGMIGGRPEYYNNVGYSHLLRGDLVQARRYFLKAYELDPSNETTANNLQLLANSARNAERSWGAAGQKPVIAKQG